MSAKGDCWDNAVAESFFITINVEELNNDSFSSFNDAKKVIFNYIDG